MSFWKKVKHYADPRTHIKAAVSAHTHAAKAASHAAHRVAAFHARAVKGAAHFAERQARKDYVKGMRWTESVVQVVTPVLAAVANVIPVVGWIVGPVIAYAGSWIARLSSSVTLRDKGVVGLDNRQRSRGKQQRTLKYGMIGSAVGGILSLFGIGFSAAETAAEAGGANIGAGAGAGSGVEYGATVGAQTGIGAFPAAQTTAALVSSTTAASSGILGTGISWSQVGSVLTGALPFVSKYIPGVSGVQQKAGVVDPASLQAGPGGTEGTGDASADEGGGIAAALEGLPLPVKLAAAVGGLGLAAWAFTSKKRKAA